MEVVGQEVAARLARWRASVDELHAACEECGDDLDRAVELLPVLQVLDERVHEAFRELRRTAL